mmetsp:Transcript_22192/g.41297  ORF Transcript_22192/g.41297 Transcript_22192/m.41297 type:complete len:248 (-) Transcript_22192:217-960(-)
MLPVANLLTDCLNNVDSIGKIEVVAIWRHVSFNVAQKGLHELEGRVCFSDIVIKSLDVLLAHCQVLAAQIASDELHQVGVHDLLCLLCTQHILGVDLMKLESFLEPPNGLFVDEVLNCSHEDSNFEQAQTIVFRAVCQSTCYALGQALPQTIGIAIVSLVHSLLRGPRCQTFHHPGVARGEDAVQGLVEGGRAKLVKLILWQHLEDWAHNLRDSRYPLLSKKMMLALQHAFNFLEESTDKIYYRLLF